MTKDDEENYPCDKCGKLYKDTDFYYVKDYNNIKDEWYCETCYKEYKYPKYVYESPIDRGMKKFKLTKKEHKRFLPEREINSLIHYDYYWSNNEIYIEERTSLLGKIVVTLCLPYTIIRYGLEEVWPEYKRMFNEKESGNFISYTSWIESKTYNEITEYKKLKEE